MRCSQHSESCLKINKLSDAVSIQNHVKKQKKHKVMQSAFKIMFKKKHEVMQSPLPHSVDRQVPAEVAGLNQHSRVLISAQNT